MLQQAYHPLQSEEAQVSSWISILDGETETPLISHSCRRLPRGTVGIVVFVFATLALPDTAAAQDYVQLGLEEQIKIQIEEGLRNEGFAPGSLDGQFDEQTRAAIEQWQDARGLNPTGQTKFSAGR